MQINPKTNPLLEKRLDSIIFVILVGFFVSVVFHYLLGAGLKLGYPHSTFLFDPGDMFNDFNNMFFITKDFSPYHSSHWFNSVYFPFANVLFSGFGLAGDVRVALGVFLGLFLVAYGLGIWFLDKKIIRLTLIQKVVLFLFNYPLLFALDRGNIEIYVFLFVAIFWYLYFFKKNHLAAGVFLALAVAMKLYPAVFVIFFLRDRKFRELGILILTTLVISVLPMMLFKGGLLANSGWFLDNLKSFNANYVGLAGWQHNNTLYALISWVVTNGVRLLTKLGILANGPSNVDAILALPYLIFVGLFFLSLSFFIIKLQMRNSLAYLILTIAMIILPNVSFDYKLIFILLALVFYLSDLPSAASPWHFDRLILLGLSLVLIPKDYIVITNDFTVNVVLNIGLLSSVLVLAVMQAATEARFTSGGSSDS